MVVFIATLFAPHTVGFFDVSEQPSTATSVSLSEEQTNQLTDYLTKAVTERPTQHVRSQSLTQAPTFAELAPITPRDLGQTPGATTTTEAVFRPLNSQIQYKLTLPDRSALPRNKSATSLASLTALDAQVVPWGKNEAIDQPKSLADSPPSQSIFNEAEQAVDPHQSKPVFKKAPATPIVNANRKKKVTEYTTSNYVVQPSTLGKVGLFSAVDGAMNKNESGEVLWVGTLGMPTDALPEGVRQDITDKLEMHHNTLAVFAADTDMNAHYENYCKTILWPLFHSEIPAIPKSKAYQDNSWEHYVRVNEAFAERISKCFKKGDIVWINDYHLMLVPALVRQKHPDAQIGHYMHSPFPPSEIFRILPSRNELLCGMLGANMIAVQTEEFRYQFVQTCSRLQNIEATEHGLVLENGRSIDVFDIPIGIDIQSLKTRRELPEVKNWMTELSEKFAGKRIIVSRDKLDPVHGISHKLRSFRALLETHPEWQDKVVLVQIATSITTNEELKNSISENITNINSEWGSLSHQPVIYLNRDIEYSQYLALLAVADCMLITSLSEGMNLTCHEFIVSQDKELSLKGHAPLVISERIGAAAVFGDHAVLVNPYHIRGVADRLHEALTMSMTEKETRWKSMYAIIEDKSARRWFETYLAKLDHAWKEHSTRDPKSVPRIQVKPLRAKYDRSERRLLILDFEGTLTAWDTPRETTITVPLRVLDVLKSLLEDNRNTVYVMSQQPMDNLEHMFRSLPRIGLVAENGAFVRRFSFPEWRAVTAIDTSEWRRGIMDMLESGKEAIAGSFIRELKSGIMFHYVEAEDQKDAFEKAGALADQINETCQDIDVTAVPFEKGLYIHSSKINKGLAMKVLEMHHVKASRDERVDFILAIGNSNEDEPVFTWAQSLGKYVDDEKVITCAVGNRNTAAKAAIPQGISGVLLTLEKLAAHEAAPAA